MRRLFALALAASLVLSVAAPVTAARAAVSGTITLDTAAPAYQLPVTFTTTVTGKLKGYQYPLVYVECSQDVLVYGQLDFPDVAFVLGGGSSEWVTRGGGAAECVAHLMIYPGIHHNDPILDLAQVTFHAEG
jgi:hypothetical protein